MNIEGHVAERRASRAAVLLLLLLPLGWLWSSVFGGAAFVPFDLAASPPAAQQLAPSQLAAARADSNHDVTEVPIWFLPELRLARRILLEEGRFPAWNAEARGGSSIHGHGEDGLLYPPNWIPLLAKHPEQWLWLLCWVSLALAGTGMFALLRLSRLSVAAALFGGITFQLSGVMAANAYFCWRLASLCWLPWLLVALLWLADRRGRERALPALLFAIAFGGTWLAGFPVYASSNCLIAAVFGLALVIQRWREEGRSEAMQLFGAMMLGAIAGVLIASPQVLPSVLFFAQSARNTTPSIEELGTLRCDPAGLLGYLMPDLFGHPSRVGELPYDRSPLWLLLSQPYTNNATPQPRYFNATEYSVYAGSLGLILALAGAVGGLGRWRRTALGFLVVLLLMALFVPGVRLVFALPVVNHVHPFRWLAPMSLFVAWLAAAGSERLRTAAPRHSMAWALAALAVAVAALAATSLLPLQDHIGALGAKYGIQAAAAQQYIDEGGDRFGAADALADAAFHRAAIWFGIAAVTLLGAALHARIRAKLPWLLCVLALADLVPHGHGYAHGRVLQGNGWTEAHDFLVQEQNAAAERGGIAIVRGAKVAGLPDALPTGMLLEHGVRDMHFDTHYDAHSHQPWLRLYGNGTAATGHLTLSLPDDERLRHPVLDVLGVTHVLSTDEMQFAGESVFVLPARDGVGAFRIYRRPTALARAFVVGELSVLPDDAAVLAAMVPLDAQGRPSPSTAWQPARTALATAEDAAGLGATSLSPRASERTAKVVRDESGRVDVQVSEGGVGLLVLSDTYLSGWTCEIDGQPADIVRVDCALRGVLLPEKSCRVRFAYRQPGLMPGLMLGVLGFFVMLALAWVGWRWRRTVA